MKRVLVTGAAGSVARFVIPELLRHGYTVRGFDNRECPFPEVEAVSGDIRDLEAVASVAEGMDAVVHLAAVPGDLLPIPELFPINVTGTSHVLEAASRCGGIRVVYTSSIQAYGFLSPVAPLSPECVPVSEDHLASPAHGYGMTKAAGPGIRLSCSVRAA